MYKVYLFQYKSQFYYVFIYLKQRFGDSDLFPSLGPIETFPISEHRKYHNTGCIEQGGQKQSDGIQITETLR
jgi:hypothetical protein